MTNSENTGERDETRAKSEQELRTIDVRDILRNDTAVCIEFEGKQYILRITSNRKLILTK